MKEGTTFLSRVRARRQSLQIAAVLAIMAVSLTVTAKAGGSKSTLGTEAVLGAVMGLCVVGLSAQRNGGS